LKSLFPGEIGTTSTTDESDDGTTSGVTLRITDFHGAYITGETQAVIAWGTNLPSTSKIQYGVSCDYISGEVKDDDLVLVHDLVLSDLIQDTTYYYQVSSVTADGQSITAGGGTGGCASFKTEAE